MIWWVRPALGAPVVYVQNILRSQEDLARLAVSEILTHYLHFRPKGEHTNSNAESLGID